jgi:hypothetical protein
MGARRPPGEPSETAIQAAVVDHWKALGVPGSLVAAIPNANAHGQPGLTKGLPDLMVLSPTLGELTGYIELKVKRGRLSAGQVLMRQLMLRLRVPYAVCYGRDEPIAQLARWGAIRPLRAAA